MAIKNATLADMSTDQMVLKENPVVREALTDFAAPIATASPAMANITRGTFIALQDPPAISDDTASDAEMSIAVLAALDCIVVDQYKEDFSLFTAQSQKSLPNPNIGDIEIMARGNSTTVPSNQFPNADSVFYELDEGATIAQQKEAIIADLSTQGYSTIVSDLVLQNMSAPNPDTLKQLSSLNMSLAPSTGTKKPTATAAPVVNTTKRVTQSATSVTTKSVTSAGLKY